MQFFDENSYLVNPFAPAYAIWRMKFFYTFTPWSTPRSSATHAPLSQHMQPIGTRSETMSKMGKNEEIAQNCSGANKLKAINFH